MPYQKKTVESIMAAPLTLGSRLGRRAITLDISILELSAMTGATRKTIYSWLVGGWIAKYYRDSVNKTYDILKDAKTREEVVEKAKKKLNVII